MTLPSTPRVLRHRAELYDQWATLLAAGVPMLRAVATLRRSTSAGGFRRMLDRLAERLERGAPLPEALEPEHRWIPPFDLALIRTGDHSGRLEVCLKDLAAHYRLRAIWLSQAFTACIYPILLLALSLLLFPIDLIVTIFTEGDWTPFLVHKALLACNVVVFGIVIAVLVSTRPIRVLLEHVSWTIPILGSALKERALARLILALDSLLNAGVGTVDAWPVAAEASASSRIRREVRGWAHTLEEGYPISDALSGSRLFPDLFTEAYRVGEISGKMDESLGRLRAHYEASAGFKMQQLATWIPRIIYVAVVFRIAASVISAFQGIWSGYDSLLQ